jgi:hypothetical protein
MSIYNPNQATRVFSVTPAPSGQNTSREVWEGFLNPQIDEINIVDERTNLLIGTIGGSAYYKFNELPKSFVAQTIPDSDILGDVIDFNGGTLPQNDFPYIRLSNGNLAYINFNSNSMGSGIFIYDAVDIETADPINGYWVAYKVSDTDPNRLEKIAELKQTNDYYNNGYEYSYISDTNENQCKFVNTTFPTIDADVLSSVVTTLNITKSGTNYTLTATQTAFNFGTTLSLYNANAPVPVLPGAATWVYRSPYFSLQNDFTGLMKGVDEGWVWYGDNTTSTLLFTYMAGYNILTGQTAFIEPISSLAATTNFNPVGVVDDTYFNSTLWESLPSGVVFFTNNQQVLDNGNNTKGILSMYSPRWENNDLVTFINQRNSDDGFFTCDSATPNSNSSLLSSGYNFDSEYMYVWGINDTIAPGDGYTIVISRFKLDSVIKKQEIQNLPLATSEANSVLLFNFDIENGGLFVIWNAEADLTVNNPQFSNYYFVYWINTSETPNRIASNTYFPTNVIGNKFYSTFNGLLLNTYSLGIEYDSYSSVFTTLNS